MKNLILFLLFLPGALTTHAQIRERLDHLLTHGAYQEIIDLTDSLSAANSIFPDRFFYQGKAWEASMQYHKAYDAYKEWSLQQPDNSEALLAVARCANLSGRIAEAQQRYEAMLRDDSLSFAVNYQLGRIYQYNNQLFKAILAYQRILPDNPTNVTLLNLLGDCYSQLQLYPGALASYRTAFAENPYNVNIAIKAINTVIAQRDQLSDTLAQAHEIVEEGLRYTPGSLPLLQSKGVLLFMERDFLQADSLLSDVIAKGDSSRVNFKYTGLSRYYRKRYFDAVRPLAVADSLYRDQDGNAMDPDVVLKYAEVLGKCGDRRKSSEILDNFEKQLQGDPRLFAQIFVIKGMVSEYEGMRQQAAEWFWKAYSLNPAPQTLYNYTNLFFDILDNKKKATMSPENLEEALFAHILFLEKIPDRQPDRTDTFHASSRRILHKELEDMFMRGDSTLVLTGPDKEKHRYTREHLKSLLTESE